jgi:hypothetical protein
MKNNSYLCKNKSKLIMKTKNEAKSGIMAYDSRISGPLYPGSITIVKKGKQKDNNKKNQSLNIMVTDNAKKS